MKQELIGAAIGAALAIWASENSGAQTLQELVNNSQYVPHGTYVITQPIVINSGVYVNFNGSTIIQECAQGIIINTPAKLTLENLTIQSAVSGAIGITMQVDNGGSVFRNITILSPWVGFNFLAGNTWHVDCCVIQEFTNVGIFVANPGNPDEGDSEISGTTLASSQHATAGIFQTSSDGLRVENVKINGNQTYGYALFAGPGAIGDLFIIGDSIEGQNYGVFIEGNGFHSIMVEGTEFISAQYAILMLGTDGSSVISGNTIKSLGWGIVAPYATIGQNYVSATFGS